MPRAEGDSWDPATGVGMTATFGAAARALATDKGLLDDPFAEPLVRAAGVKSIVRLIDDHRFTGDDGADPLTTTMMNILGAYTRFLDGFLADAARAGIRQVVILASGLDTRPYRLWWPPGTTVYEIDRPEVLDFKSAVLSGLGAAPSANRRAVGADLRQDWPAAVRRVGFDAAQPTAWVAEQLLVGYLAPAAQRRLLDEVAKLSVAGSLLAADHMAAWTPKQLRAGQAFVDSWRRQGLDVDLASLTHLGEYRYVPEQLASHGWEIVDRNIVELLAAMGLPELWRGSSDGVAVTPRYLTARLT
jgi:methyltransferase (TIGR00027 family)